MKSEKLLHTQNEDLSVYAGVFWLYVNSWGGIR